LAFFDTTWYCNAGDQATTGYYAVAKRPQNAAVVAGQLVRQFTAPAVGSERVFICTIPGTTANVTDATWATTRGGITNDGTVTWQECTGMSAVNGDAVNTPPSSAVRNQSMSLAVIIKNNTGTHYFVRTAGGSTSLTEPTFNTSTGATTTDGSVTWTCIGPVGNFTGGQAPHARLANACAANWFAAGNTVYVGDNHAESQATAITIAPAGSSLTTVGKIICHNHSGSYPPGTSDLTAGASISTTAGVNITFNPTGGGSAFYLYGISFVVGAGSAGVASYVGGQLSCFIYFDRCLFKLATTFAGAALIQVSNGGVSVVTWNNCTVYFGNALHYIDIGNGVFTWQNTGPVLASGSAVPSGLLGQSSTGRSYSLTLEALDLSQITGALDKQASAFQMGPWLIKDCKLNASMTIPTPQAWGEINQLVRSDSAATAYKSTRYAYEGTETTETSITRVGGASDPTGQAQSRKIVTTANGQWLRPYKAEPYAIWNPTTGTNVTVTVYGTVNAGTLPNNDDIWLEVEYLGSAASPLGTIVTTTKANLLAANAAVTSDGSTWNGGGSGAGWTPFKLVATLSSPQPGLAGYLHARVRAAKPSTTYYFDPKISLT
jgi:hypothetical protein